MTRREDFEAWATTQHIDVTRDGFGGYMSHWTEGALEGWQAAIAQKEAQQEPAPGDIRALKHRIHELEGEVIGYKRILEAQQEPCAYGVLASNTGKLCQFLNANDESDMDELMEMNQEFIVPLYTTPPNTLALLRQVLEALENSVDVVWEEYTEAFRKYDGLPSRKGQLLGILALADAHNAAIAAIREVLK